MHGYVKGNFNPYMHFVLGKNDPIINPFRTIEIIKKEGYSSDTVSYTHLDVYKRQILYYMTMN